ncbi:SpoIIE family protein phosphatase [Streptomyces sp. YU58]|uniref:ATP-binding SpoIIE family protein phosphatase n=1 Tax=Streptomyces sp. SX92 TaxID=3158972 RepID=UPI0027B9D5A7|nr:SpoIIE family protein phosphatase [Streptomyces coralus]WLW50259.1 SpoIIE family protein phosphatase [Streptomyces coralus]
MSAQSADRASHAGAAAPTRLALLASAAAGLPGDQAVLLTLQQATAGLGGLGGVAHRRDPGSGTLRLMAASGLAPAATEAWACLPEDSDSAPARAVRGVAEVWLTGDVTGIGASGTASVPLPGPDGPVGALSVFTVVPAAPETDQWSLLRSVAAWVAEHLDAPAPDGTYVPHGPFLRTLRGLHVGFVTVDDDWRVTFANEEAERLLAAGRVRPGSVLWDFPATRVRGLEAQCRRAAAEGRPVGFDLRWPTDQRLYHVRLDPVPGSGLAVSFLDVTDRRLGQGEGVAEERAMAARTARMGVLTVALAEAVTSQDVVRAVAEHVLLAFGADGLVVEALEAGRVRVVDSVGYPHEFLSRIDGVPLAANTAVTEALRTRTPAFVESTAAFIELYPNLKSLTATSPMQAWAFLPLIASGHAVGCCVVSFARPRSFDEEERTLLTALSGLVAQALERARLYDVEHTRAQGLQRDLLPRTLPSLPAASAAARYLPAGRGGDEVGGDWYDVIPLSADRVAIVIGDVMGHGITEAATMGRLRTAVRTLADLELEPVELLGHLNELVGDLGYDHYATCAYAVYDPVTRTCSFCLAGHPPPLLVHPDGTVHSPELTVNPPLGAAEPPFDVHEVHLPDESLLVFCTDGLVESATRDTEEGLVQLRRTLAEEVSRTPYFDVDPQDDGGDLDRLCDHIVSALVPDREGTTDDAALLITRIRGTPAADVVSYDLPHDPRAAGQARAHVRDRLAAWDLDELAMTTELLVSELVGNVVRHAQGPIRLRLLRSRSLICEVYDHSLTTPRIRRAGYTDEGGRGLHLVAALSRRWGTRFLGDGKCIWTEQDLPPGS